MKKTTFIDLTATEREMAANNIFSIIKQWIKTEKANLEKSTKYEQEWMDSMINFDFRAFYFPEEYNRNIEILERLFASNEQCFIASRMRLLASEILQRFGIEVVELMQERLIYSFIHIFEIKEKQARELVAQFPCLWIFHIAQGFSIYPDL